MVILYLISQTCNEDNNGNYEDRSKGKNINIDNKIKDKEKKTIDVYAIGDGSKLLQLSTSENVFKVEACVVPPIVFKSKNVNGSITSDSVLKQSIKSDSGSNDGGGGGGGGSSNSSKSMYNNIPPLSMKTISTDKYNISINQ